MLWTDQGGTDVSLFVFGSFFTDQPTILLVLRVWGIPLGQAMLSHVLYSTWYPPNVHPK